MFTPLLPQRIDNTYRGHKLALWLFVLLILLKTAMSLNAIFNGYDVASTADRIPLDTFTPAGAGTVVSLFALLGLANFTFCLLGLLALVRYRAMIPLLFALLLLEQLSRKVILRFLPIVRSETPPGSVIVLVLLVVMIVGLALSLWSRDRHQASPISS